MPVSRRQQLAARAEYGRRKRGGKARVFKGMSTAKLRKWAKAGKLCKK